MDKLEPIRAVFRQCGLYNHAADDLLCERLAEAMTPKTCAGDLDRAIATAREAHTYVKHLGMTRAEAALGDLLAALDAARGEAVAAANVTPMRQPRADLARLVESINAAVYANGDGLSVTEAIGALELAKLELLKEQEQ